MYKRQILNLQDIKDRGLNPEHYHFLAGSAINGWKNEKGEYDPRRGGIAMEQAVKAFRDSSFDNSPRNHVHRLHNYAQANSLNELKAALEQRYVSVFK